MVTVRNAAFALIATAAAVACVDAEPPPGIPLQAQVEYGNRIYLVDFSQESPTANRCTKFGVAQTNTGTVVVNAVAGFGTGAIDVTEPHNCFIPVVPKTLTVDQVEVTNDLFQLCVDSNVCQRPDPSDASAAQVCSNEDDFERCPVVDVTREEANRLCSYIGRRLPTMVEHIAIRQNGFIMPADVRPEQMRPYINGTEPPGPCADALLASDVCNAVRPSPVGPIAAPTGAAPNDRVEGSDGQPIFDLMGSQAEWARDGFSANRGTAEGLPWFCIAPLPEANRNPPSCPELPGTTETAPCVYGDYQPDGQPYGTYAVCITTGNAAFSGQYGSLSGGSIEDNETDPRTIGVFSRRRETDPEGINGTRRSYGFRCVDDRTLVGTSSVGEVRNPFTEIEVDTNFSPP